MSEDDRARRRRTHGVRRPHAALPRPESPASTANAPGSPRASRRRFRSCSSAPWPSPSTSRDRPSRPRPRPRSPAKAKSELTRSFRDAITHAAATVKTAAAARARQLHGQSRRHRLGDRRALRAVHGIRPRPQRSRLEVADLPRPGAQAHRRRRAHRPPPTPAPVHRRSLHDPEGRHDHADRRALRRLHPGGAHRERPRLVEHHLPGPDHRDPRCDARRRQRLRRDARSTPARRRQRRPHRRPLRPAPVSLELRHQVRRHGLVDRRAASASASNSILTANGLTHVERHLRRSHADHPGRRGTRGCVGPRPPSRPRNARIIIQVGRELGVQRSRDRHRPRDGHAGVQPAQPQLRRPRLARPVPAAAEHRMGHAPSRSSTRSRSTTAFFGGAANPNNGLHPRPARHSGLGIDAAHRQAAQTVQISAFPDAYAKWETRRDRLVRRSALSLRSRSGRSPCSNRLLSESPNLDSTGDRLDLRPDHRPSGRRPVSGALAHRPRRHGHRLPRDRPAPRAPRRDQGHARPPRRRQPVQAALHPGGALGGPPRAPQRRQRLRPGSGQRLGLPGHGVPARASPCATCCRNTGRSPRSRRSTSWRPCSPASRPRTRPASCTATSSPRTCCSPTTAASRSATSASPAPPARTPRPARRCSARSPTSPPSS